MKDETKITSSNSLAVRQFCDIAFGWMPVHAPNQPFRVETVTTEERYCLACCGVRHFDVVRGVSTGSTIGQVAAICRCCGAEVRNDVE
jgi:hypothetical protein